MALDVKIILNMIKPVGTMGFGVPLILEENAAKEVAYTEVSSLTTLVEKGYTAESNVYKTAQLMFLQEHAPKTIAVCSTTSTAQVWISAEANVSKGWRQLVVINAGETATAVADIMSTIEVQTTYPKMYYANVAYDDATEYTVKDIERTVLCYYTPTADVPCPVAALVGEVAGLEVGSYTINNMTVKGISGLELSEEEVTDIHQKGGITFVLSAGDVVASEGITAGGSYVDNVDGNDYIKQQLEVKTQKTLNKNLKIPYTDVGIALLESVANEVMTDAQNKGIVDTFEVKYALREETTEEDRASRKYVGGKITYTMAGAVHSIDINCQVSV